MTWRTLANQLLSTLFEPPCAACRQRLLHPLDGAVCDDCWAALRLSSPLIDQLRAGDGVDWSCAIDRYEGRMKEIVHALKYERRRSIARPLGELMRIGGARLLKGTELVVPVPLHPRREFQRGFNQADDLARHLGLPVVPLLKRIVFTQSQIELPKDLRQENVKNAFSLRSSAFGRQPVAFSRQPAAFSRQPAAFSRQPAAFSRQPAAFSRQPAAFSGQPAAFSGQPAAFSRQASALVRMPQIVVLVDDVSTTGSTLDACARVLKRAGVKEVRALTAARVVNERR